MRLYVVIPVFNERETLPLLVERLDRVGPPRHPIEGTPLDRRLVVVDDGSTDGTADVARGLSDRGDTQVVVHERNRGKGAAVRSGFSAALAGGADVVLIQDGDLEYDPADHASILAPILDGRADATIGSRFLGGPHRVLYYWHWVANRMVTTLSNMLTNLNLTDIECCLKAVSRPVAERLRLKENRFGVEPELVAKLARMRLPDGRPLRIYEAPVSYAGRTYAEGKKITWRDGFAAVWCILKYNLLR
jgi:glycosyltransferase involved in cell wall biosynthesis